MAPPGAIRYSSEQADGRMVSANCRPAVRKTQLLAAYPTGLSKMPERTQERLVNWGYAVADASLRAFVAHGAQPPVTFPYRAAGVG
jgi:hypothetical protein